MLLFDKNKNYNSILATCSPHSSTYIVVLCIFCLESSFVNFLYHELVGISHFRIVCILLHLLASQPPPCPGFFTLKIPPSVVLFGAFVFVINQTLQLIHSTLAKAFMPDQKLEVFKTLLHHLRYSATTWHLPLFGGRVS